MRLLTSTFVILLLASPALAQGKPVETKIKMPTRLDWAFVAGQFGTDEAKLADGYDSAKQRYQLFVPKNYDKAKTWPLVIFVSPDDNAGGWSAWKKVCEEQGVLFCAPQGAG